MKRIWKKAGILLLLSGILGSGTVVWSAFSDTVSVRNHISLGDVNIKLSEKELKEGKEIPYQNPKIIFPGDYISKIPMITNLAEDCWVRARIQYRKEEGDLEGFSDDNLGGFSSRWVKQGEYFYYTDILETGESIDLFHTVHVPEEWTEEHAGQHLAIDIQTDAIQAKNFRPDFEALSPWGDHPIELCVHEENGRVVSRKAQTANIVEFNGAAHRLIAVPDDFFSGFGTMMPGDIVTDHVQVGNTTKKSAEIFFRTETIEGDTIHEELLQKLELTITMNGKKLYQGPLHADALSENVSLIRLDPGKKGQMDFSVRVPEELNNPYALSRTDVKWVFTVQEDETEKNLQTDPGAYGDDQSQSSPVRTGDESRTILWISILVSAGIAVIFTAALKKGGKNR